MLYTEIMCIVFSLLTIYLCNDAYKKGKISKRNYTIVCICEGFVAIGMLFLLFALNAL